MECPNKMGFYSLSFEMCSFSLDLVISGRGVSVVRRCKYLQADFPIHEPSKKEVSSRE